MTIVISDKVFDLTGVGEEWLVKLVDGKEVVIAKFFDGKIVDAHPSSVNIEEPTLVS